MSRRLTFTLLQRALDSLPPNERMEAFGRLPEEQQAECWQALAHREQCRGEIELDLYLEDRGAERPPKASHSQRGSGVEHTFGGRETAAGRASGPISDDVLRSIPPPIYVAALTGESVPAGGGYINCPIPDHEDRNPSCRVYPDPGRGWWCFACGRGGDAITLAAFLTGLEPRGDGFLRLREHVAERLLLHAQGSTHAH